MNLGILGGGQLALMLVEAGSRMGLSIRAFVGRADEPVGQVLPDLSVGSLSDVAALRSFLSGVDLAVFESEFVPVEALRTASEGLAVTFLPSLSTMAGLQDKIEQKKLLGRLDIPVASYSVCPGADMLGEWIAVTLSEFENRCVFKWSCLGYDGKGNFAVAGECDSVALRLFCEEAFEKGGRPFCERFVPFAREVAVIGFRSVSDEAGSYPVVESEQWEGICREVRSTSRQPAAAHDYAARIGEGADIVGCFGVEMFELSDGSIVVNEIAPRVHNTGHYTQDACDVSQFEMHWRCVLGLPLPVPACSTTFAMRNLLGQEGLTLSNPPSPPPSDDLFVHWYGKAEVRPRRKLGHVNALGDRLTERLDAYEAQCLRQLEL